MFALALAAFVLLLGWGADLMGWQSRDWELQQAICLGFVLGGICGYKAKG